MNTPPYITIVSVCRSQNELLRELLTRAGSQAPCVLLLDGECAQGDAGELSEEYPGVTILRVPDTDKFNMSQARNLCASRVLTEWLCFLEVLVLPTRGLVDALRPLLKGGRFLRPGPDFEAIAGTIICSRADFQRIGGYDEVIEIPRIANEDIVERLFSFGITQTFFPADLLDVVDQDVALSGAAQDTSGDRLPLNVAAAYCRIKRDLRRLTGEVLEPEARRAVYGEVSRVLSQSIPARGSANLEIVLPRLSLRHGWQADRKLVYTIPPPEPQREMVRGATEYSGPPVPFIVGTGRCGSTLLRLMLDSHPDLAIPDEAIFMPVLVQKAMVGADLDELTRLLVSHHSWRSFGVDESELRAQVASVPGAPLAVVLRAFYGCYARRFSKSRYGDKTIVNTRQIPLLGALLSEAHFIHLVRDGRDVAVSMRGLWFGLDSVAEIASYWATTILSVRATADPKRYLELRFEDLVDDPETALRRVCDFIDLRWNGRMLDYHLHATERLAEAPDGIAWNGTLISAERVRKSHALTSRPPSTSPIGVWKSALTDGEVRQFDRLAGSLLTELGYETTN